MQPFVGASVKVLTPHQMRNVPGNVNNSPASYNNDLKTLSISAGVLLDPIHIEYGYFHMFEGIKAFHRFELWEYFGHELGHAHSNVVNIDYSDLKYIESENLAIKFNNKLRSINNVVPRPLLQQSK